MGADQMEAKEPGEDAKTWLRKLERAPLWKGRIDFAQLHAYLKCDAFSVAYTPCLEIERSLTSGRVVHISTVVWLRRCKEGTLVETSRGRDAANVIGASKFGEHDLPLVHVMHFRTVYHPFDTSETLTTASLT